MENEKDKIKERDKINNWLEKAAIIIITSCIICLLSILILHICSLLFNRHVVNTVNIVASDSLQKDCKTYYVNERSTDSICNILTQHERELSDKYQYVIEQKDYRENAYTIGGVFVGVTISIFSFFGYKSLKSIEDKVEKDSQHEANTTAELYLDNNAQKMVGEKAESLFKSSASEVMKADIIKTLNESIDQSLSKIKEEIRKENKEVLIDDVKNKLLTEGYITGKMTNQSSDNEENMTNIEQKNNEDELNELKKGGLE